jgi:hypothetical protein
MQRLFYLPHLCDSAASSLQDQPLFVIYSAGLVYNQDFVPMKRCSTIGAHHSATNRSRLHAFV